MERFDDPARAAAWRRERPGRVGFVPTMGALHEGHLTLVRLAAAECDLCLVSVFVNPLQFDDPADLERYPLDFEGDCARLEEAGCDAVFTGTLASFFPEHAAGDVPLLDPGPSAEGLEGAHRQGHFAGVATIVARLFDLADPDVAYFGEKDFQQTLVVRDLARSRGGPEVVVVPTVREEDGLALSSRNARLSRDARDEALALSAALYAARDAWGEGERDPDALCAALAGELAADDVDVEYAEVRDPDAWSASRPRGPLARARAFVAARVGGVRLIDTLLLDA